MIERARARFAALEHALVAGLRANEPEELIHIAASLQDNLLDDAAAPHASRAFRAGLADQRRQLAARIGAPILPDAPDWLI